MAEILPKRRTRSEIERADTQLLLKHDEYFQAWVKKNIRENDSKYGPSKTAHGHKPSQPTRKARA